MWPRAFRSCPPRYFKDLERIRQRLEQVLRSKVGATERREGIGSEVQLLEAEEAAKHSVAQRWSSAAATRGSLPLSFFGAMAVRRLYRSRGVAVAWCG